MQVKGEEGTNLLQKEKERERERERERGLCESIEAASHAIMATKRTFVCASVRAANGMH